MGTQTFLAPTCDTDAALTKHLTSLYYARSKRFPQISLANITSEAFYNPMTSSNSSPFPGEMEIDLVAQTLKPCIPVSQIFIVKNPLVV